jgi:hypothetical protein
VQLYPAKNRGDAHAAAASCGRDAYKKNDGRVQTPEIFHFSSKDRNQRFKK